MLLKLQEKLRSIRRITMNNILQRRGMQITNNIQLGTNSDKTLRENYCVYCYQNRDFLNADTLAHRVEKCIEFHTNGNTDENAAREKLHKYSSTLKNMITG
jgi:hypothetical protein